MMKIEEKEKCTDFSEKAITLTPHPSHSILYSTLVSRSVIVSINCGHILQSSSLLENTTIISIDFTFKTIFKVKYSSQTHPARFTVTIDID
jgi:hypothetical protein